MENTQEQQVLNLDLTSTAKKKVVVNGNENDAFYINTSDFGIYDRLRTGINDLYRLFLEMRDKVGSIGSESADAEGTEETDDEKATEGLDALVSVMRDTDAEMRSIVDTIFNAPVSDICAPDGYMFDMFEGQLRFEYIISAITKLYENNINAEFYKMKSRINAKLPKYVQNGKK